MDAETGRIVHSRDVTWHQSREPLIFPAPTVGSEVPQSPSGTATPEYIVVVVVVVSHIQRIGC